MKTTIKFLNNNVVFFPVLGLLIFGVGAAALYSHLKDRAKHAHDLQLKYVEKPTSAQSDTHSSNDNPGIDIIKSAAPSHYLWWAAQAQKLENKARNEFFDCQYQAALDDYYKEEQLGNSKGYRHLGKYRAEEIECEFRLGHETKALEMVKTSGVQSLWNGCMVGIIEIHRGRPDLAKKYFNPDSMVLTYTHIGFDYRNSLPGTETPRKLEASLRLARGISFYFVCCFKLAEPEFLAAHQLEPSNTHIAYYLSETLNQLGYTAEAIKLIPLVKQLGGPLGQEAYKLAEPNTPFVFHKTP